MQRRSGQPTLFLQRFRQQRYLPLAISLLLIASPLPAAELPQVFQQSSPNYRFSGANLPQIRNGGRDMIINQTAERATLHWKSFDIAPNHSVEFRQPSASSVALNRIFDSKPSEIAGRLTANGQVYLINQNGILFKSGAQINTQSLIASTLQIDDEVFTEIGFVNAIRQGDNPADALAAFDMMGAPIVDENGEPISINIEQGASIKTADGGRVLVFAPSIVNEGSVTSNEGQVVLAASQDKVWIAPSADNDVRGLVVEVSTGGDVTNLGEVIADRGNVTMVGLAVNQDGVARATTSVSLNGSVRLLARDLDGSSTAIGTNRQPIPQRAGTLTLGGDSETSVTPDDADGSAADSLTQSFSFVEMVGQEVTLESGAQVTATGGDVIIEATADAKASPDLSSPGQPGNGVAITLESGAVIDVSGDDSTAVPVDRNVVEIEARGNELADSPLQRDGPIRGQKLRVDVREDTEFLIIGGAAGNIERSAAERQSAGGSVALLSEGSVSVADGAVIDVSGGQVEYTPGRINTSQLETTDGRIVDISQADPNRTYRGVISSSLFARNDRGYVEGKDAGSLRIEGTAIDYAGDFAAGVVAGINQRERTAALGSAQAFTRAFQSAARRRVIELFARAVGQADADRRRIGIRAFHGDDNRA